MKNQKGITLVALIITIIVMLILAGVSISLVVGEDGVLTQAQGAGKKTKAAEFEQAVQLAMADLLMEYYGDTADTTTFTKGTLEDKIEANGNYTAGSVTVSGDFAADDLVAEYDGMKVDIDLVRDSAGVLKIPYQAKKVDETTV